MNPYEIIGVEKTSSHEDIKKAYRKLSLLHHPDRNGNSDESNKKFQDINQAYNFLTSQPECIIKRTETVNLFEVAPLIITLDITLLQAYLGCMLPVEIERWVMESNIKRPEREKMYVQIPRGIDHNEILLYRDKGNVVSSSVVGVLKIIINITKHMFYERIGLDLIYTHTISLKDALCGVTFQIHHISGKKYTISNSGEEMIITPDFKRTIRGMGLERGEHKGDLIIQFIVQFPSTLSKDKISQLLTIL